MSKTNEQGELIHLDDIGKVFAKALRQSDIHTFADLATYTPKQLSQTIEEKTGLKVSPDRIEAKDWIGQAKAKLADEAVESIAVNSHNVNSEKSSWQQQAGFSFFFDYLLDDQGEERWRTRYFHQESNVETAVERLDLGQVTQYIREKANVPFNEAVFTEAQPDVQIEETTVRIKTVDAKTKLGDESSEYEVVVDVTFEITGEQAAIITEKQYPFLLKMNLINDADKIEDAITIESTLEPGVYSYQKQRTFAVPHKIGRYQIQSELKLEEPAHIEASKSGPILKVTE